MEFVSQIFGADSFRKLVLILGGLFLMFALFVPRQKAFELKEKQIKAEEEINIDLIQINYLNKEVEKAQRIIRANTKKITEIKNKKDSTYKGAIALFNQDLISSINKEDQLLLDELKINTLELEKKIEKTKSLEKEIVIFKEYYIINKTISILCTIFGSALFLYGLYLSRKGQKETDLLRKTELLIKEEELKKLKKENKRTSLNIG